MIFSGRYIRYIPADMLNENIFLSVNSDSTANKYLGLSQITGFSRGKEWY